MALDFGTATSPVASGYQQVLPISFSQQLGMGWTKITGVKGSSTVAAKDSGKGGDLTRDYHVAQSGTFQVNLPSAKYSVTVGLGGTSGLDKIQVTAEGTQFANNVSVAAGQTRLISFTVSVTDGRLQLKLADKGGDTREFAIQSLVIQPESQAPTATLGNNGAVNEASPVAVTFSNQAGGTTYSYSYDFNNDGAWDLVDVPEASRSYTFNDNGSYTVKARIKNEVGLFTDYTTTVTINNVAPTATFGNAGAVTEGSTGVVSFTNQADVSSVDAAAGYRYSYDFNNDGTFETTNSTSASVTVPASYLADGPGTRTVRGRILDKDGGFTDYTTTITINNVAPTATLSNNGPVQLGNPVSISFSNQADVSSVDAAAGYKYSYDFDNNGTFDLVDVPEASRSYTFSAAGTYTVKGRIADKDGGFTDYTTTVTVSQGSAPTANLGNSGPVNEASSVSITFTNQAGGTSYTYSYDFNNDGTWDLLDVAQASRSTTFNDNGSYTVRARIKNELGLLTDYTTSVTVNNVAPTGSFGNAGAVNEGSTGTVSFTNQADVSSVDAAAGYRYSYDFNNDGTFETTNSTQASATVPATYLADGPGTRAVKGRIIDKDGGFTDYTTTITINNVAPTATFGNNGPGTTNNPVTISFSNQADASSTDAAAGYTYSYDFNNDGTWDLSNVTDASRTYTWSTAGTYTVKGRIADKDGGARDYTTTVVIINPNGLVAAYGFNETSGSSLADSSGNALNGTVSGATWSTAGKYGGALSFDGVDDWVTVADANLLDFSNSLTLEAWVKLDVASGTRDVLIKEGTNVDVYNLYARNGNGLPEGNVYVGGSNRTAEGTALSANTWVHLATTYDGSALRFYANGTLQATTNVSGSIPASTGALRIGGNSLWGEFLDGMIDEVRLYNRALTQAEIQADMNTPVGPDTTPPTVSSTNPANNATNVPVSANLLVTFSESLDSTTVSTATVQVRNSAGTSVSATVTYNAANATVTIDPNSNLAASSTYTIWVQGGAAGIADTAGNRLVANFSSSFTTAAPDSTPPTVQSVTPSNGATGVSAGTNVSVVFSEGMDPVSLTSSTVRLKNSTGTSIAANLSYNSSTFTVTLDPNNDLAYSSTYTVEVVSGAGGVKDLAGNPLTNTFTSTFTTGAAPQYIDTPYDRITNFGAYPTIVSVGSGAWSSVSTWSLGRLPQAGDIVSIANTTTVTYDVVSDLNVKTVAIQAGGSLRFRTDMTTRLTVTNLLVMPGGELQIGTVASPVGPQFKAEVIIANVVLDTASDPGQYGNGLIALGKVTMHGAVKSPFVRLTGEPKAGDTTLTLSEPVTGWQVGDRLVLPDSRQQEASTSGYTYQYEEATIATISTDGRTVTLTAPLQFDHPGARNGAGVLEFTPHIGNRTRNVVVRSQSSSGTRGHVFFTHRADVDVRYAGFGGLGRTTIDPTNNSTNVAGRHPVHFANLIGPQATPANGYQYTFVGNAVFCAMPDHHFKWGVTINNSHYGLIKDNFIYNWAGAGLVTQQGNESYNVIEHNFAMRGLGEGDRAGSGKPGDEGQGFWLRGPNNYFRDNVAANFRGGQIEAAYGFKFYFVYLGNIRVPNFKGADVSVSGQYTDRDGNSMKLLEVARNEAYGVESGFTYWWVNTFGAGNPAGQGGESVIKDLTVWNQSLYGVYGYESNKLTIDGFTVRGGGVAGLFIGDYYSRDFVLTDADFQGLQVGISRPSTNTDGTAFTIKDSYFRNQTDIDIGTLYSSGSRGDWIPPRTIIIRNCRFDALPGQAHTAINMNYDLRDVVNLTARDEVFVYDYDQTPGYNFQLYYVEQRADFVLPQSTYNSDGTLRRVGSPQAGLTNQQNWTQFGIALAGAVAPGSATTLNEIGGLVRFF